MQVYVIKYLSLTRFLYYLNLISFDPCSYTLFMNVSLQFKLSYNYKLIYLYMVQAKRLPGNDERQLLAIRSTPET